MAKKSKKFEGNVTKMDTTKMCKRRRKYEKEKDGWLQLKSLGCAIFIPGTKLLL